MNSFDLVSLPVVYDRINNDITNYSQYSPNHIIINLQSHNDSFSLSFQFLQNLGKVDRTADDIFDEHLQNFTRQQNAANRLQKEFNNYIRCVRGKSRISMSLSSSAQTKAGHIPVSPLARLYARASIFIRGDGRPRERRKLL